MSSVTAVVLFILGFMVIFQAVPVLFYVRRFRQASRQAVKEPSDWPMFHVGLPLRGADPTLPTALEKLLTLDYPNYSLHIVVDSKDDPAWRVAQQFVESHGHDTVKLSVLQQRSSSCSMYAASLAQYLDSIDGDDGLVAFADADMEVPSDWLKLMASALSEPTVGATLGNRWYVLQSWRVGSHVRFLWNAGAVISMWLYEMPWTGALAMRLADVRRAELPEKLRHGMTEDAPVKAAMKQLGLKLKFVPQLTIPNFEEINAGNCYRFVERQILWTRLYHPRWAEVVVNAVLSSFLMFGPAATAIVFLCQGDQQDAAWLCIGTIGYLLGMWILMALIMNANHELLRRREVHLPRFSILRHVYLVLLMPVAQLANLVATIRCQFVRTVEWRGIHYKIRGPWDIEVISDKPFEQKATDEMSL